ncbi:hypothetical protein GOP47_0008332 [Adiantum capillus-veneris]|uniref:Uncharacterized protein n=1 Tax=Adiantum capillus-veneris TaxID=13818 RepID=A0A9D4ZJK7_ADICA|nr:hypothetical protein GOP47_0008332 [Adiantum capillus-veneris]
MSQALLEFPLYQHSTSDERELAKYCTQAVLDVDPLNQTMVLCKQSSQEKLNAYGTVTSRAYACMQELHSMFENVIKPKTKATAFLVIMRFDLSIDVSMDLNRLHLTLDDTLAESQAVNVLSRQIGIFLPS